MFKFILLGALQGITEFLPVSSSGHLVIAQHFLGMRQGIVSLDVFLHIGTMLAILTFFFRDIIKAAKNLKLLGYIAVVTLLTGSIGIIFKNVFESCFLLAGQTAVFLCINGLILLLTRFFKDRQREPNLLDSVAMGAAQGLAIIPGISRSGLTITTLLSRGVKKEEAFKFSFIASIPAVFGAFLVELKNIAVLSTITTGNLIAGIFTSYLCGLLALWILLKAVKNKSLHIFGYYCIIIGISILFFLRNVK